MIFWIVGALVINDLLIIYTGYLYYKRILEMSFTPYDFKILHCEKCGRPEIVTMDVERLKVCNYCTGHYCEHCDEVHRTEDDGYKIKVKKVMDSKKKSVVSDKVL